MNSYAIHIRANSAFSEQSGRALLLCTGKEGASMKPWAEQFYNSEAWHACRDAFLQSKGYLCERCSTPHNPVVAKIAHHKTYLTKQNVNDPNIALSWNNLEALCQDCHNKISIHALVKRATANLYNDYLYFEAKYHISDIFPL